MKLNNAQIKALAQEVLNKIPEVKKEFSKEELKTLKPLVNEINKLQQDVLVLLNKKQSAISKIKNSGLFTGLYDSDCNDLTKMAKKIRKNNIPSLENIVHKITLETIFETKESMNDFIDNLVKQYSK